MKEKILKILTEATDHISGETLSKELGVSRTAVWKSINKLKDEGYQIDSIRNKGYRLERNTTELVTDAVRLALPEGSIFETVKVYDTIDSTNTEAKRLWQSGHRGPALIIASEQTQGKGRRGRRWLSPKGECIAVTMLLMPDIPPTHASMLTLIAGLSVCRAVEELTGLHTMIKWPNDLVLGQKKVCGILTEMSAEMDFVHYVLVGTGINVNQMVFDDEIRGIATSLAAEYGKEISRPALIGAVVGAFEELYEVFVREKNLTFMLEDYNKHCINVGRELKVITRQEELIGTGLGINPSGELQIKLKDGTITQVNAGEVSVRGLYGYI